MFNIRATLALSFTTVVLLIVGGSSASAADFCVGSVAGCAGTNFAATSAGLANAISGAEANAGAEKDTVKIAAGTYATATGFHVEPAGAGTIDLVGGGMGVTTLRSTTSGVAALDFTSGTSFGTVSDMTVELAGSPAFGTTALILRFGGVRNVEIATPADGVPQIGMKVLEGATNYDSVFKIPEQNDIGVLGLQQAQFINCAFLGDPDNPGIGASWVPGSEIGPFSRSFQQTYFYGLSPAVQNQTGKIVVADSLIDLADNDNGIGVAGANYESGASSHESLLNRVTIVGTGDHQTAVVSQATAPDKVAKIDVRGSVIQLKGSTPAALRCVVNGDATAAYALTYSAFDANTVEGGSCTPTLASNVAIGASTALFKDPGANDYRPTFDSPLVDAGDPGTFGGSEDFYLNDRQRDGDRNNLAFDPLVDIGAAEYQAMAPEIIAMEVPTSVVQASTNTYSGDAVDPDGEPVVYAWDFGTNAVVSGKSVSYAFPDGLWGTASATLTATDPIGLVGVETAIIGVTRPVLAPQPKIFISSNSRKAFARTGKPFAQVSTSTKGPKITINSNVAASLRVTMSHVLQGVRKGGKCRMRKARQHGAKCKLEVAVPGLTTLNVSAGTTLIGFGGRFGGKQLPSGDYRAFFYDAKSLFGYWIKAKLR